MIVGVTITENSGNSFSFWDVCKILGFVEEDRKRRQRAVVTIIFILFVVSKSYGRELRVPYHKY